MADTTNMEPGEMLAALDALRLQATDAFQLAADQL